MVLAGVRQSSNTANPASGMARRRLRPPRLSVAHASDAEDFRRAAGGMDSHDVSLNPNPTQVAIVRWLIDPPQGITQSPPKRTVSSLQKRLKIKPRVGDAKTKTENSEDYNALHAALPRARRCSCSRDTATRNRCPRSPHAGRSVKLDIREIRVALRWWLGELRAVRGALEHSEDRGLEEAVVQARMGCCSLG
jgi:hypothetical protein